MQVSHCCPCHECQLPMCLQGKARCVAPACGLLVKGLCTLPDLTQLVQCIPNPMEYTQLLPQQADGQASQCLQPFGRAQSSPLPALALGLLASEMRQTVAGAAGVSALTAPAAFNAPATSSFHQQSVLTNGITDHSSVTVELMPLYSTKETAAPAKQPAQLESCGTGASSSPKCTTSSVQGLAAPSAADAAKAAGALLLGPADHHILLSTMDSWRSQGGEGSGDWLLQAGQQSPGGTEPTASADVMMTTGGSSNAVCRGPYLADSGTGTLPSPAWPSSTGLTEYR
jgi:hypothetical protein